jgi:hypothetical protein
MLDVQVQMQNKVLLLQTKSSSPWLTVAALSGT